jgi:hypothetical protein
MEDLIFTLSCLRGQFLSIFDHGCLTNCMVLCCSVGTCLHVRQFSVCLHLTAMFESPLLRDWLFILLIWIDLFIVIMLIYLMPYILLTNTRQCSLTVANLVGCSLHNISSVPSKWTWNGQTKKWRSVREKKFGPAIYNIHPATNGLFFFRMLTVVPGARSFEDLKTYHGTIFSYI